MKRFWSVSALVLVAVLVAAARAQDSPAPDFSALSAQRVVLVPVDTEIGDGSVVVLRRAIREASGAALLVLMIDTPGGKVDSAIDMSNALLMAPCKTLAYVHGMGAISAGALIAYSCDEIIMTEGTSIGASAPVSMGGELPPDIAEKTKSFLRARYRSLGETKGHNPLLGEAMVDSRIELHGYRDESGAYKIVRVRGNEPEPQPVPATVAPAPKDPAEQAVHDVVRSLAEKFGETPAPASEANSADEQEAVRSVGTLPAGAELIDSADELLTLTSRDAERLGLSAATVPGIDQALMKMQVESATRDYVTPTRAEKLYAWITSPVIAGILFMLGLAGLYFEMKTPGFGVPGALGLACLGLFFGAHLVLGVAEWFDLILVIVGIVLIGVEIFVLPGLTLAGVGGLFCVVLGMYLAVTRVPIPQYAWDYDRLNAALQTLVIALVSFMLFVLASWRFLPKSRLGRMLVQSGTQEIEAGYTVQQPEVAVHLLGREGVAISMLRPAGRGRFGEHTLDVVTRGEFVDMGTPLRVVQVDGNRCIVETKGDLT